jgi:hypothetical protein
MTKPAQAPEVAINSCSNSGTRRVARVKNYWIEDMCKMKNVWILVSLVGSPYEDLTAGIINGSNC